MVPGLITVKQQVGYLCGPPTPTLITPTMNRVLGGPQITLRLQTGGQEYLINRSLRPRVLLHRWAFRKTWTLEGSGQRCNYPVYN